MTSWTDILRQLGVNLGYTPHGEDEARPSTSRPVSPGEKPPWAANPFTQPLPLAQQGGAMPPGTSTGPRMASGQQVALPLPAGPPEMSREMRETFDRGGGSNFISPRTPAMRERLEDFIGGDQGAGPRRNFAKGITSVAEMTPAGTLMAMGDLYNAQREGRTADAAWDAVGAMPGPVGKTGPLWHGLSKTKLQLPIEEMRALRVPTGELAERKILTPEALQGSVLIPAIGDRTMAGHTLKGINDKPLAYDVNLEGGPDYMRAGAANEEGAAWASHKHVVKGISENIKAAAKEYPGRDINLVYTGMGERSGDFSHMNADALLAQVPGAPIEKADAKAFDETIRKFADKKGYTWPGLQDTEAARAALLDPKAGNLRKTFVEEMAKGRWQQKGFPDIGSTRWATTEPELVNAPTGASGYAITRVDPAGKFTDKPGNPHTTYPRVLLGGEYQGSLDEMLSRQEAFPGFYAGQRAAGARPKDDDYVFGRVRVRQLADQEWLDQIMKRREGRR